MWYEDKNGHLWNLSENTVSRIFIGSPGHLSDTRFVSVQFVASRNEWSLCFDEVYKLATKKNAEIVKRVLYLIITDSALDFDDFIIKPYEPLTDKDIYNIGVEIIKKGIQEKDPEFTEEVLKEFI